MRTHINKKKKPCITHISFFQRKIKKHGRKEYTKRKKTFLTRRQQRNHLEPVIGSLNNQHIVLFQDLIFFMKEAMLNN